MLFKALGLVLGAEAAACPYSGHCVPQQTGVHHLSLLPLSGATVHADAALIRACSPLSAMQPHSPGPCGKPMGLATGWRPGAGLHSALVLGGTPSFALCCFRALHKQQLGEGPSIPERMETWASSDSLNCSASRDTAQGHVPHCSRSPTGRAGPPISLTPHWSSQLSIQDPICTWSFLFCFVFLLFFLCLWTF